MKNIVKTQTFIGEIQVSGNADAAFSCEVSCDTELSLILQDELGRSMVQKNFAVTTGHNDLEFRLPTLNAGSYNAWIDVNGETFIRQISIDSQVEPGLLSKFKQWLNVY